MVLVERVLCYGAGGLQVGGQLDILHVPATIREGRDDTDALAINVILID